MLKNKIILSLFLLMALMSVNPIKSVKQSTDIEFWYIEPDETDDTLLSLIGEFETSKGVTVTVKQLTASEAKESFKAASMNGTAPDIIQGYASWIPEFVTNGMITSVDLANASTEYMAKALRAVSYYEIKDDIINANNILYYGYPQRVDTQAFLYSHSFAKEMRADIAATGETWDITAFKNAITKLNDQSDPANKKYGFSFTDMPKSADALFYGYGGQKFSNYTVDKAHIEIESDISIEALQFMYEMVLINRLTPSFEEQGSQNTYLHFAEVGDLGSTFGFAADVKKYLSGSQFSNASNLGIAPIPKNINGTGAPLEVMALMISTGSSTDEKLTAIELAEVLTSKEAMVSNAKNEYLLPASWEVFEHEDLAGNTIVQSYKAILQEARELPITKYWDSTQEGYGIEVGEMLAGDQNGTIAARAIKIRWSFLLPASTGVDPIPPVGIEVTETKPTKTPAVGLLFVIAVLSITVSIYRKKR
ncbi:MAG: sugar ABC transporter substrate-binding protein [Candidatus Hodarchaeales archaeon]